MHKRGLKSFMETSRAFLSPFEYLLGEIQRRPGVYLGQPSAVLMRAFLDGYLHTSQAPQEAMPDMAHFSRWMGEKYKIRETWGWPEILRLVHGSDEAAFYAFFGEWQLYKNSPTTRPE